EAVVLLAIPMILELGLESVFAVVDMFFVSKLGQNAIATVGLTESIITIIYSLAIGISTGATAVVARRIGEKDPERAAHAGAQSLMLAVSISIFVSIFCTFFAGDILRFMGASQAVVSEGTSFAQIMFGGSTVILLIFLINGIFRGAGDAAMAMRSLWIASGINIVLCPVMIHLFGLKGAAIATVLGRTSGVLYQSYHLFKGSGILKILPRHFTLDFPVIKSIVKIAWPATFQFLIGSGSWIVLTRLVAESGGTAASAGFQIAFRNFVFFILPAWGLSNAAATLVGQNLGAKNFDRAEQSVLTTAKYSIVLMTFVTLIFLFGADPIIRIFATEPDVIQHGVKALRIIGSGFIFYGFAMVMIQALNGAGDTKTPTWINIFCFWIFQTPFAYYLAFHTGLGASGAVVAMPISEALLSVVSYLYFKRGHWKTIKV
ncbi:MAG: MATE family efflux transporter, partial [Bdellovibrionales bacterium]|nr:MATE family efflux transporter [Bdellovibrionales bacterium]